MKKQANPLVKTFEFTKIIGVENIDFGKYIIIDDYVLIYAKEKIMIGNHVHIASFTSISGGGELEIGDYTAISSGCRVVTGTDDFKDWGFGNSTVNNEYRNLTVGKIKIGQFCIIGGNSVILPNVTIGEGVAVGAGSVVTKDLEPWGIYVGNTRIGSRDKSGILENYDSFISAPQSERLGDLFCRES